MFRIQNYKMTPRIKGALQCLLDLSAEKPIWLSSLVDSSVISAHFDISQSEAQWISEAAHFCCRGSNEIQNEALNYLISECSPANYYLLNSGICSPSY